MATPGRSGGWSVTCSGGNACDPVVARYDISHNVHYQAGGLVSLIKHSGAVSPIIPSRCATTTASSKGPEATSPC